jgi:AcrR family transcriptional regulator
MASDAVPLDRRRRRRLETIEEVLDVAVAVMAEQGVAGLSLGEVARRMGIRPPSLYVYFPSKNALYDALFARGARSLLDSMQAAGVFRATDGQPLEALLLTGSRSFVAWAVAHPTYSQLLFWRPVPGFTPTPEAYAPAVELLELVTQRFAELQRQRLIRDDVTAEQVTRDWTVVTSGVVSQQLSNGPDESFEAGMFSAALPRIAAMFATYYQRPVPNPAPQNPPQQEGSP